MDDNNRQYRLYRFGLEFRRFGIVPTLRVNRLKEPKRDAGNNCWGGFTHSAASPSEGVNW